MHAGLYRTRGFNPDMLNMLYHVHVWLIMIIRTRPRT